MSSMQPAALIKDSRTCSWIKFMTLISMYNRFILVCCSGSSYRHQARQEGSVWPSSPVSWRPPPPRGLEVSPCLLASRCCPWAFSFLYWEHGTTTFIRMLSDKNWNRYAQYTLGTGQGRLSYEQVPGSFLLVADEWEELSLFKKTSEWLSISRWLNRFGLPAHSLCHSTGASFW